MRLLVDAQLPIRLASVLADLGHDVVHTSQLPVGNRTPDVEMVRAADSDARVVVTKNRDFLDSHVLLARPHSLLLVCRRATFRMTNSLVCSWRTWIESLPRAKPAASSNSVGSRSWCTVRSRPPIGFRREFCRETGQRS